MTAPLITDDFETFYLTYEYVNEGRGPDYAPLVMAMEIRTLDQFILEHSLFKPEDK